MANLGVQPPGLKPQSASSAKASKWPKGKRKGSLWSAQYAKNSANAQGAYAGSSGKQAKKVDAFA